MSFLYKTKIVSSVSWQASRRDADAVFVIHIALCERNGHFLLLGFQGDTSVAALKGVVYISKTYRTSNTV